MKTLLEQLEKKILVEAVLVKDGSMDISIELRGMVRVCEQLKSMVNRFMAKGVPDGFQDGVNESVGRVQELIIRLRKFGIEVKAPAMTRVSVQGDWYDGAIKALGGIIVAGNEIHYQLSAIESTMNDWSVGISQ